MTIDNQTYIQERQGIKIFNDIDSLCKFLLFASPKNILIQSGTDKRTGQHVYQLQWGGG